MKKEFKCGNINKIAVLSHTNKGLKEDTLVIMHAISEEDEKRIDDSIEENPTGRPMYYIGNKILATGKSILTYGTVNLNSSDDINFINSLTDIVNPEVMGGGNWIPSGFDYASATITSDEDGKVKWYQTWDSLKWFKYNHCLIGKPKRVIIYKIKPNEWHGIWNTLFESNNK